MRIPLIAFALLLPLSSPGEAPVEQRAQTALHLAEIGEFTASKKLLEALPANNATATLARGLWLKGKGEHIQAIALFEKATRQFSDPRFPQLWVQSLQDAGAHQAALATARKLAFSPKAIQEIELGISAAFLRWDRQRLKTKDAPKHLSTPLAASLLARTPPSPESDRLRLLVLINQGKRKEALAEFEKNTGAHPLWFRTWIAQAYLDESQAEAALALLPEKEKGSDESDLLKLRAQLASGETELAQNTLSHLRDRLGTETQVVQGVPEENWKRVELELEAPWINSGDLSFTRSELNALAKKAPLNGSLRSQIGEIERWQGNTRQALSDQKIALSLDPESLSTQIALTQALLDNQEFSSASARADALPPSMSFESRELKRRLRLLNSWELTLGSGYQRTGPLEQDLSQAMRLSSPLLWKNAKIFAGSEWKQEGLGGPSTQRHQLGAEWLLPGKTRLEAAALFLRKEMGFRANADFSPADAWDLSLGYDHNDFDQPVFALLDGIAARTLHLGVAYRYSDSARFGFASHGTQFSDGNRRLALALHSDLKLFASAKNTTWIGFGADASRNSLEGASYFNPSSDSTIFAKARHERRHDRVLARSFSEEIEAAYGIYRQSGEEALGIGWIRYAHAWEIQQGSTLTYGFEARKQAFDGENRWSAAFDLNLSIPFSKEPR